MSYWQFRLRVYRESLYQWLASIKQISVGLIALFPLALPALILIPLLALSVLANPSSNSQLYFSTLWAYLLFTYSWIAMQRDGITANNYHFYNVSLPVNKNQRVLTELAITLYAANILILGPLILLCIMLAQHIEDIWSQPISVSSNQLLPIIGLIVLAGYYSISAVQQRLPWLSLLVMPILGMYFSTMITKNHVLAVYFVSIFFERYKPLNRLMLGSFPNGIWRFYLQADIFRAKQNLIRYVAIILLLIIADICTQNVVPETKEYVGIFFSFLFGVLLATKLMDILRLRKTYQFYLALTPISSIRQLCYAFIYCLLYLSPALLLLASWGIFNQTQWLLLLIFYLSSQVGIFLLSKYFLVMPICSAVVLWLFS